jgi:hypothetical protein
MKNNERLPLTQRLVRRSLCVAMVAGLIHVCSAAGCPVRNEAENRASNDVSKPPMKGDARAPRLGDGKRVTIDAKRAIAIARAFVEGVREYRIEESAAGAIEGLSGWGVTKWTFPATYVEVSRAGKASMRRWSRRFER